MPWLFINRLVLIFSLAISKVQQLEKAGIEDLRKIPCTYRNSKKMN